MARNGSSTSAPPSLSELERAPLTVLARLIESSNGALVGELDIGGRKIPCVYKPIGRERPLWDFPDGSLAAREVASFHIAEAAGWRCVPPTVLRDGPAGPGMVQWWIEGAGSDTLADVFPIGAVPQGWLAIFRGQDQERRPVVLAHADMPELATIALFDAVTNNADRKVRHLLASPDGTIRAVDHGLTCHVDPKLRTILWGWAGEPIPASLLDGVRRLRSALDLDLSAHLIGLLTEAEIESLAVRIANLLADPVFPLPPTDRSAIPWPPI